MKHRVEGEGRRDRQRVSGAVCSPEEGVLVVRASQQATGLWVNPSRREPPGRRAQAQRQRISVTSSDGVVLVKSCIGHKAVVHVKDVFVSGPLHGTPVHFISRGRLAILRQIGAPCRRVKGVPRHIREVDPGNEHAVDELSVKELREDAQLLLEFVRVHNGKVPDPLRYPRWYGRTSCPGSCRWSGCRSW